MSKGLIDNIWMAKWHLGAFFGGLTIYQWKTNNSLKTYFFGVDGIQFI